MLSLLTQFGSSSSGLGALGLNAGSFVIQLITFVIALLILKRWAFKPILKIMNDRRETIAKGVELGEKMQKESKQLEERITKELAETRQKADTILADASSEAKDAIRKAESEAAERAEVILSEAREQTKQDIARAKRQLEGEIVKLISDATEVLTEEKVDSKKDADLIARALHRQAES